MISGASGVKLSTLRFAVSTMTNRSKRDAARNCAIKT
jgi:hypothetical protein